MHRIRQLPAEVYTRIAAGEVIERPASVVKELLENAIDAGAERVEMEVANGGSDLIRIADNGGGILAEDLPLAFASHATSKLSAAEDLARIGTLGFRGEALSAIASVAQVLLQSRPRGLPQGAEIECRGGELSALRPWNGAAGTRVEVRHLFFNTPVRRRFLRSTATELSHISEVVMRQALAHPALHLKLTHNDRLVFEVPASAGLHERIELFCGREIAVKLLPVDLRQGPARLTGFIADPACNRPTSRWQYFFVNGRCVRDRSLSHALQEAYRGLIMTGRYCVAFLFLELPLDHVDVNVHPAKAEVRFRDAQAVYHLMLTAVRDRLRRADLTPQFAGSRFATEPAGNEWKLAAPADQSAAPLPWEANAGRYPKPPHGNIAPPVVADPAASVGRPAVSQPLRLAAEPPITKAIQLHDSYLVMESAQGMLVIDQHALHERIIYEDWRSRLHDGAVEVQKLLVPEPVDLPADLAQLAIDHQALLAELGLLVEPFGGGTILVTGCPAMLRNGRPAELLHAAVEHLGSTERLPEREELLDELIKMLACRSAIKAGDRLSIEEIAALLARRELADNTHHCPHGRPTALLLSKQELDRQFKRT